MRKVISSVLVFVTFFLSLTAMSFAGQSTTKKFLNELQDVSPAVDAALNEYISSKSCEKVKAVDLGVKEVENIIKNKEFIHLVSLNTEIERAKFNKMKYLAEIKSQCKDGAVIKTNINRSVVK